MTGREPPHPITNEHLERDALLYVRQSSPHQVFENTESTERQYKLRDRAIAHGWSRERVKIIDDDLGHSGASTVGRDGFQRLVAEVGMGRVGLVMGLEVSRLARNNADWHRLLELCALNRTLILDEDGLYDPNDFNDRLVLGLKGTMSEAELHFIRSRLRGGILNKAKRGELVIPLPVGLVYSEEKKVVLDPDRQVQEVIRRFFRTYARLGSAHATMQTFRREGIRFPRRPRCGPHKGDLLWGPLHYSQTLLMLRNPRYSGAFVFGRRTQRRGPQGGLRTLEKPKEQWLAFIPGAHPGYITWEEYERNLRRLRETAQSSGIARRQGPPREGPALLQGLAICGLCGYRMGVCYRTGNGTMRPVYFCRSGAFARGDEPPAKLRHPYVSILGEGLDKAVGELLLRSITPLTMELELKVQQEIESRLGEEDRLRRLALERAEYEVNLARHRFMRVDPDHRLVADNLEAEWNEKLRVLSQLTDEYERWKAEGRRSLTEDEKTRVRSLARSFPSVWSDPRTTPSERKRMLRLLVEDATLLKGERTLTAQVRLKGGAAETLTVLRPPKVWEVRRTVPEVLEIIRAMAADHTDAEVADALNRKGFRPIKSEAFNAKSINGLRRTAGILGRREVLRARGLLTTQEVAKGLGVGVDAVLKRRRLGTLDGIRADDRGYLFHPLARDVGGAAKA